MTTERIGRAVLAFAPTRRKDLGNITPLWIGTVQLEDGNEARVWIRQLPGHELMAELFSTAAGRAMGLPIPRPFLIDDPRGFIGSPHDLPLFGSEDAEHPSLRQRINNIGEPAVMDDIMRWPALRPCGCFDDQIANSDRNLGNLLFDGEHDWVLIDQAHALGGPRHWPGNKLSPAQIVGNQVLDHLLRVSPDLEGKRLPMAASFHAEKWADLDWSNLIDPETLAMIDPDGLFKDVVSFMESRLPLLPLLMQQRKAAHSAQHALNL